MNCIQDKSCIIHIQKSDCKLSFASYVIESIVFTIQYFVRGLDNISFSPLISSKALFLFAPESLSTF